MHDGNRPALRADIDALLERNRGAPEMGLGEPASGINAFVEEQLARLETIRPEASPQPGAAQAPNTLFHATLDESIVRARSPASGASSPSVKLST